MSTNYNESCFKRNQRVSLMLVFVDLYYNYKSSHAVFYDLVSNVDYWFSTFFKDATVHIQFFDDIRSDIKLRTGNIFKILFCKNMNDSSGKY